MSLYQDLYGKTTTVPGKTKFQEDIKKSVETGKKRAELLPIPKKTQPTQPKPFYNPTRGPIIPTFEPAEALAKKFLGAATLGLTDVLTGVYQPERTAQLQKQAESMPVASTLASVAGYIAPTTVGTRLAQPLIKPIASGLGKRVAEGAIVGGGIMGVESVAPVITGKKTIEQAGKDIGTGILTGAALDASFYGLGRLSKPLLTKIAKGISLNRAEKEAFKSAMDIADDQIDNMLAKSKQRLTIQKELGLPESTTAQQFMREQRKVAQDVGVEKYYNDLETAFPEQATRPTAPKSFEKPQKAAVSVLTKRVDETIAPQVAQPIPKPFEPKSTKQVEPPQLKPKVTDAPEVKATKLRQTVHNSVAKSELDPSVKAFYEENPAQYEVVNNQETWQKAFKNVSDNPNAIRNELGAKTSLESADDTMNSIALMHKYSSDGDIKSLINLSDELAEKATRSGQAIQALIALQRTTPEGKLLQASQTINAAVRQLEKEYPGVYNAMKKKGKLPKLSEADASEIKNLMEKSLTVEGKEKAKLVAKADQIIADNMPVSFGDKVRAFRNISLLLNPKTLIRNPLGNVIFSGLENVSQIPSGITDVMVSAILKTPRQTKVVPKLGEQLKGAKKGTVEAWQDILEGVDTSPTRGGIEMPRNRKIFETAWLNKVNNWLGDALKMGDRPFYQAAYDARLKELIELQPDAKREELEQLAKEFGMERTFQNDSETAQFMSSVKSALNKANVIGYGLGDVVMPYTQTPANIIAKGAAYTPLGILNSLGIAIRKDMKAHSVQKAFTDSIGRAFTGTGILALGYTLAKNGFITGSDKDLSKKEKALRRQAGERQYAIKFGDQWVSFDWAQPASMPLALGANLFASTKDEESLIDAFSKGTISAGDTMFNQGVMQGITRMLGGTSPTESLLESVAMTPTQFLPTAGSQVAQQIDPYQREIDYSSIPQTVKDSVIKKIPGARETLPQKLDMFGVPIKEQSGRTGIQKAVDVFINPSLRSDVTKDKTTLELYRLYDSTKDTDVVPLKMPSGLTKEQERAFKVRFGQRIKGVLDSLLFSDSYRNSSDDVKAKLVSKTINKIYEQTKEEQGLKK